jgi:hypothetical protein
MRDDGAGLTVSAVVIAGNRSHTGLPDQNETRASGLLLDYYKLVRIPSG